MNFTDDNYINDEDQNMEKNCRTVWVGNLHPKVTCDIIAELFYQVGPIESIQFAIDEHDLPENFAWITFKHSSAVEDSIKLLHGTKLYGLPIVTKHYSKHLEDPVFDDQLDYFKQLVNVEHNSRSNDSSNKSRWIDRSSDHINYIPDSLPAPPVYDEYNINHDGYNYRSNAMSRHGYNDKSSKYQQNKPYTNSHNSRKEYKSFERSYPDHGRYTKSDHNSSSSSMEVSNSGRDSYNHNYDRKHRDINTSSSWQDTKKRDHSASNYDYDNDYNARRDNFQEYDNSYPNNSKDNNWREKNRPNNYKYNHKRSQNMETSSRQNSSYHPYKQNDEGYGRKEYRNSYDERKGYNHGRSYNRGGSDRARQNYNS